ncbi:MAG: hypothetical protein ACP5N2_01575 [Candidatus Nanoarchaeia archaeon]
MHDKNMKSYKTGADSFLYGFWDDAKPVLSQAFWSILIIGVPTLLSKGTKESHGSNHLQERDSIQIMQKSFQSYGPSVNVPAYREHRAFNTYYVDTSGSTVQKSNPFPEPKYDTLDSLVIK